MRRRLRLIAAATLVLVVGGLVAIWSLEAIVKRLVERYGSEATQVAVHVDAVALSLLGGSAAIDDLSIANPSGFSSADAFRLGEIQVRVDRSTLLSNPVVIDEISIVAPQVQFEVDANGTSNVDVIRHHLAQFRSAAKGSAPGTAPTSPGPRQPTVVPSARKEAAGARRFLIKRLSIHGAQLAIDTSALGGERRVVTLPDSEETDIGARGGGATGSELAALVVGALVRDVAATVAAANVEQALEKGIGGEAGKAVGEGVGEAVKSIGRALNKLFGDRQGEPAK